MVKKLGVLGLAVAAVMAVVPSATAQEWQGQANRYSYYEGEHHNRFWRYGNDRDRWEWQARQRELQQQAWREHEWREKQRREKNYLEGYPQGEYHSSANPWAGY